MTDEQLNKIAAIEQGLSGEWKAIDANQYLAIKMPLTTAGKGEILISTNPEFTNPYFLKYDVGFINDNEYFLNTFGMMDEKYRYRIFLNMDKLIVLFSSSFGLYQSQEYHRLK